MKSCRRSTCRSGNARDHYDAAKGSPITWMVAIARNRALDEVRRKKALSIEETPEALEVASDEEHPLDRVERGQQVSRLAYVSRPWTATGVRRCCSPIVKG